MLSRSIALPSVNLFFPQLSTEGIFLSALLTFCEIKTTRIMTNTTSADLTNEGIIDLGGGKK